MHNLHYPWRCSGKQTGVRLQKQSLVQKPQTGPGERRWSPVWFAFGAFTPRQTFTNGRGEGGGGRERWVKGEKEVSMGVMSSQGSHVLKKTFRRFSLSHKHTWSVRLPPTVGIPRHLCDRVSLSEECFVRSQGAPHIRGIRLAPVR